MPGFRWSMEYDTEREEQGPYLPWPEWVHQPITSPYFRHFCFRQHAELVVALHRHFSFFQQAGPLNRR
jgi:hypothetical protein